MKLCLINKLQKFNSNSGAQLLEYPGIRIRRLLRTCKNKNIHYYINSRPKPPFNIITEPRTPLPVAWSPMEKKKLATYGAIAVADPDLQLRGVGGGGGAGGLKNIFFGPTGHSLL